MKVWWIRPPFASIRLLFASVVLLWSACVAAQTNCEAGAEPRRYEPPRDLTTQQVIEKFAARETEFRAARRDYTYTQDVTIQTLRAGVLPGRYVADGEYRQVMDVSYDSRGKRLEHVTLAPQSSLRSISLSLEDMEDIRFFTSFTLPTEELQQYSVIYQGQQHVDQLDTYVFDIAPKAIEPRKRYFQGRL